MAKLCIPATGLPGIFMSLPAQKVMFRDFLRCCMTLIGAGQRIKGRGLLPFTVSDK